jgi:hypothetical protein
MLEAATSGARHKHDARLASTWLISRGQKPEEQKVIQTAKGKKTQYW